MSKKTPLSCDFKSVGRAGLEPATNGLPNRRSGRFRLLPIFCCVTWVLVVQRLRSEPDNSGPFLIIGVE